MIVENNKIVSVTYELKLGNKEGETIEVSSEENPLIFPFGGGMLLPAFENGLLNKEVGDSFEIEINAKDGYGEVDEYMVINIPKSAFIIDGKIDDEIVAIGNTLPMMSSSGHPMNGLILSIEDDEVIMDFNHPLAGQDLYFNGKVIDVRDTTDDDLFGGNHEECESEGGCGTCGCGHKH